MSSVNLGVQVRDVNVQQGMEDGNIYRCGGEERRAMCDFVGVDQSSTHNTTHTTHNTNTQHRVQQRRRHQGEGCDSVPRVRLPHSHEEAHDENRSVRSTLNLYDVDEEEYCFFTFAFSLRSHGCFKLCQSATKNFAARRCRFACVGAQTTTQIFLSSSLVRRVCVCTLFGP